ncbi:MAG: hypothetical protein ACTSWY_08970 [Promethearchaeota archaeon]
MNAVSTNNYAGSFFIKRMINEIEETDEKVQIIGKITGKINDVEYRISDDTGEISVIFSSSEPMLDKINEGMIIKVLGKFNDDSMDILDVQFVSDYSNLNFDLYKKTHLLKKMYLNF